MKNYANSWPALKRLLRLSAVVLIATIALLLTSCGARKKLTSSTATERTEHTIVRETVRDTLVRVAADSSLIRALVECDSLGRATLKQLLEYQGGERLKPPQIDIDANNVLTATASVDSLAIYMQLKERYESHNTAEVQTIKETIEVEVNRLTGWQSFWIRCGQLLAAFLAGYLLTQLFKPKILTLWQKITKN